MKEAYERAMYIAEITKWENTPWYYSHLLYIVSEEFKALHNIGYTWLRIANYRNRVIIPFNKNIREIEKYLKQTL